MPEKDNVLFLVLGMLPLVNCSSEGPNKQEGIEKPAVTHPVSGESPIKTGVAAAFLFEDAVAVHTLISVGGKKE